MKKIFFKGYYINDGAGFYCFTSTRFFHGGMNGISRCLKAQCHDASVCVYPRLRLLTEKECFRLMDINETDIDKILKNSVIGGG